MIEEKWPESVAERLKDLYPYGLGPKDKLTYEWRYGYEVLTVQHDEGGSYEFRGVFHPRDGLCYGNPCYYCGTAYCE